MEAQALVDELTARSEGVRLAVRSSAAVEDAPTSSFAGGFETVLDVRTREDLHDAIRTVRESRSSDKVRVYVGARAGEADADYELPEMSVVVQELVCPDYAGVLFTADPVTGSRTRMLGNYVRGLGDHLVSGDVNPEVFALYRPTGLYDGPRELRRFGRRLFRLARRLEKQLGGPQDIEWAVAERKLYLLQSRPITTLQAHVPATGEWNDSMLGDFLWTNGNMGEAFPDVMTPFTWSMVQELWRCNGVAIEMIGYPMGGNIGGRTYYNMSVQWSGIRAMGMPTEKFLRIGDETFGRIPPELEVPFIPVTRWWVVSTMLPMFVRWSSAMRKTARRMDSFITETPALVDELLAHIVAAQSPEDLLAIWRNELGDHIEDAWLMSAGGLAELMTRHRRLYDRLEELVGEKDANALLSGVSSGEDALASLGVLVGLSRLSKGEMSRCEYLRKHGHRGPDEFEFSVPRPYEDPEWIDRQLANLAGDQVDPERMLAAQHARHDEAWKRLASAAPRKRRHYRRKLDDLARASRRREAARSESIRLFGAFRAFAVRAGRILGLGDDVFFLAKDEMLCALEGDRGPCAAIAARKRTYARYKTLPPYPPFIRGRFDPFDWAANPSRRTDYFDATAAAGAAPDAPESGDFVTGFAGAAGQVEGVVRVLAGPGDGDQLLPGEVLVAATTNIGWTPFFPRAAAVVTDVGAPLSHAAIIARELGIPAVVGCTDATMRLKTGDRVLVDGGRGLVRVLRDDAEFCAAGGSGTGV